jgi:tRNA (guanine37-N1)-methyltransferase
LKQIAVITPVPEIVHTYLDQSILRKGQEQGLVEYHVLNLRDFAEGNYRQIDDEPYGGGSGMVLMAEPLFKAIEHCFSLFEVDKVDKVTVVYPSPQGTLWNHAAALELSKHSYFIFLCGHYKGIDQRVIEKYVTHEYSVGDYILSSGELPALLMIDSIVRLVPGVLHSFSSAATDSFYHDLLDAPYYTRPQEIDGMKIPEVLLTGHHQEIETWRQQQRERRTRKRRPDLWKKYLQKTDRLEA